MSKLVTTEKREEHEDCVIITSRTREISAIPSWVGGLFVGILFLALTAAVLGVIVFGWVSALSLMNSPHHAGAGMVMVLVVALSIAGPLVLWTQLWCHVFERGATTGHEERGREVRSSTRVLTGTAREADIAAHRERAAS